MSTMMRVPVILNEQVEILQSQRFYSAKSKADVLDQLISSLAEYDQYKAEQTEKWDQERQRKEEEDVYLGTEIKNKLIEFQNLVNLKSPAQTIEFLIDVFDSTHDIGKLAFFSYVEIKKRG